MDGPLGASGAGRRRLFRERGFDRLGLGGLGGPRHGNGRWPGRLQIRDQGKLGELPDGWSFKEVAAVGVDNNDNVYAFGRGDHPMMVFDREGKFLRSWGEGQYPRAHGVHMGPDIRST